MAADDTYETPKRRTLWLSVAFAILAGIGVATVLLPELEDDTAEESATSQDEVDRSDENGETPSE